MSPLQPDPLQELASAASPENTLLAGKAHASFYLYTQSPVDSNNVHKPSPLRNKGAKECKGSAVVPQTWIMFMCFTTLKRQRTHKNRSK